MLSCIRCQQTSDDGYLRVNLGLCTNCARELHAIIQANRRAARQEAQLATVELPGTYR